MILHTKPDPFYYKAADEFINNLSVILDIGTDKDDYRPHEILAHILEEYKRQGHPVIGIAGVEVSMRESLLTFHVHTPTTNPLKQLYNLYFYDNDWEEIKDATVS
jgi:hypothetical protein